jgi:hypothetical protein
LDPGCLSRQREHISFVSGEGEGGLPNFGFSSRLVPHLHRVREHEARGRRARAVLDRHHGRAEGRERAEALEAHAQPPVCGGFGG